MDKTEEEQFRRKLALWLDEREVDLALRENHESDSETQENGESTIVQFDSELALPTNTEIGHNDLQKGDILLLSSELSPQEETDPLFVAVLRHWEDDYWLFAPYSPYSHPATDKEMKTDSEETRLQVLSLWNCHTTSEENLKKSWFIGKLSEPDRKDAINIFWYSLGMKELTKELEKKVGPKLFHPSDPRRNYIDEELSKTSVITEKSLPAEETETSAEDPCIIIFPNPLIFLQTAALAASDDEQESSFEEYMCKELPIKVSLQYIPRHEQIVININTDDKGLKDSLDQFKVKLIDDDKPYLTFENGDCVHPVSLKSIRFALVSPDGNNLTLIKDTNN